MCSGPRKKNYFGKNRFRRSSAPPLLRSKILQRNIVEEREGAKPAYRNELNVPSSPLDVWEKFFTDELLEKTIRNKNAKIQEIGPIYQNPNWVQDMDLMELKAFIEFLFYIAIFKENHEHYTAWYTSDGTGREIYSCIIGKNRLEVLLKTLRFYDSKTRLGRKENDHSAPIGELFNSFIEQCQAIYAIGN
ncbi:hypothetical protein EVAR_19344_1 [Eumeta japonica]|uniref:PiggyBac transposable element-derived protein domain-containing protein n=1 Tax=Eumeta variegata TaxID=151549 RepID=A0A4C1TRL0_EUMVA|nr:hypothetical protein EVAR_19344_1 [Eumeta japonica]